MQLRAVVVDVGGVLEHTPRTGWVERWEARLGLRGGGLAAIVSPIWRPGAVGQATLADIQQRTATALGLDAAQSAELWSDMWTEYLGTLNNALVEFLAALRPHFRTAILSNSFVGAREREQARYGFEDLVDHVVYSHEEGMEKPAAELYALTCDRLGVVPEQAVFVDDLTENIEGAAAMGMRTVLFEDTAQTIKALREHLDLAPEIERRLDGHA